MYFRRYTRMTLYPALKYFTKYGVIDQGYQKFVPLLNIENPPPEQRIKRKFSKAELREKDLDTKLIDRLFLKYPDLKYEPISCQKYGGRKLNTFSYAYSFIAEQKKLIQQGYQIDKAFQIVQQKYQQQMQRKLDQTLLSRKLAIGNRARSFLNLYQQQAEFESRMKVLRTKRELQKYQEKLENLKARIQKTPQKSSDYQINQYQRIFQKIIKEQDKSKTSTQSLEQSGQSRREKINRIEKNFKNVFNHFYQRAATKDRLQSLTDEQIINNIHVAPKMIKKKNKQLIQYLKKSGLITIDHTGQVRVLKIKNINLEEFLFTSPQIKIALLTQVLDYEKPWFNKQKKTGQLMKRRKSILMKRPDQLTKEQKDLIKYNKTFDMKMISNIDLPMGRSAYKIFESSQERLLRLQLKYLNKVCEKEISELQKARLKNKEEAQKYMQKYQEAEASLAQTIQKFRRIKYRLQNKFKKSVSDEFLFIQHNQLGDDFTGDDVQYEILLAYLKKKSQERRLTSISRVNDNAINEYLKTVELPESSIAQGEIVDKITE